MLFLRVTCLTIFFFLNSYYCSFLENYIDEGLMIYFYIIDKFMILKGKDFIESSLELTDSLIYLNFFSDFFEAKSVYLPTLLKLSSD